MASARPRVSEDLLNLSNKQWEDIIDNYIKNEVDRIIAKRYYLDGIPQCEIAEEVNYSRSTIKKRLPKILDIIERNTKN